MWARSKRPSAMASLSLSLRMETFTKVKWWIIKGMGKVLMSSRTWDGTLENLKMIINMEKDWKLFTAEVHTKGNSLKALNTTKAFTSIKMEIFMKEPGNWA